MIPLQVFNMPTEDQCPRVNIIYARVSSSTSLKWVTASVFFVFFLIGG